MSSVLILAATAISITAMVCLAVGRAWKGWLEFKRLELAAKVKPPEAGEEIGEEIGVRIELAAVRERLKKLEAIASGVEL